MRPGGTRLRLRGRGTRLRLRGRGPVGPVRGLTIHMVRVRDELSTIRPPSTHTFICVRPGRDSAVVTRSRNEYRLSVIRQGPVGTHYSYGEGFLAHLP